MKSNSISKPTPFKKIFGLLSQHKVGVVSALLITACLVVTFAVSAYSRRAKINKYNPSTEATAIQPLPRVSPSRVQSQDLSAELVTIHPYGFEPEELNLSKGQFLLAIDNRSGLNQVSVQLLSPGAVGGTFVRSQVNRMARGNLNWNQIVDLQPGEYVLTEENHPNWTCKITIKGK